MQIRRGESGQIIVLFALALIAMIAMAGLVLDGGATYGQRRAEQNAADLAALAGATVQVNNGSPSDVKEAALKVAAANGYDVVTNPEVTVTVMLPSDEHPVVLPGEVQVDITAPHQNYFAGIVGLPKWDVSVTATAAAGVPTGALGAAPIIFSIDAFDSDGLPYSEYGCASPPCASPAQFGLGNGDVPDGAADIAWTLYGDNVNTDKVRPYLAGTKTVNRDFQIGDYIGQSNNGYHNSIFGDGDGALDPSGCTGSSAHTNVDDCLSGKDVVVPIVSPPDTECNDGSDDGGCFQGWALFHVVSAEGGSERAISGYFVSGFSRGGSADDLCTDGKSCPGFHGLYVLKLVN